MVMIELSIEHLDFSVTRTPRQFSIASSRLPRKCQPSVLAYRETSSQRAHRCQACPHENFYVPSWRTSSISLQSISAGPANDSLGSRSIRGADSIAATTQNVPISCRRPPSKTPENILAYVTILYSYDAVSVSYHFHKSAKTSDFLKT